MPHTGNISITDNIAQMQQPVNGQCKQKVHNFFVGNAPEKCVT